MYSSKIIETFVLCRTSQFRSAFMRHTSQQFSANNELLTKQGVQNMSSKIFRTAMLIAGMALLSVFLGTSTVHAAKADTAVCDGLSGNAFGICTAAVSSGCATDGRSAGSKHCNRLEANFTNKTGDDPVWLATESVPDEPEPEEVVSIDIGLSDGGFF